MTNPTAATEIGAPGPATCSEPDWDEADRLAALDRYAILDSGREAAFDDVAELAADILDAPIAVVNFIAADRQWFKAEKGIGTDSLPLDVSICRHAILQPGVFVVPDLTKDARFENNPLVNAADGLRFYAGALLETPDGLPLGTVCVLDTTVRPNGISERQERALRALAAQTMAQLELRRSKAAAQQESDRLSAMFAQATVGMSEVRLNGRFLTVNDRLCEMLGRTRDELLALRMSEVTHPDDLAENIPMFDRMAETGASFSLDKRYVRPDGTIVWANSSVTRLLDERGCPRAALAVTTDITARKEEERYRAFLLELGDRTRDLVDPEAVVATTTCLLGERLGAARVLYADIHEAEGRATVRPDWTAVGVDHLPPSVGLADVGGTIVDHLRQGRVLCVDDVQSHPVTRGSIGFLDGIGVRALISVPLLKNGALIANLNVHMAEPHVWTPAELALVEAVAERTWEAMQRAVTQAALRESEARQAFLLSLADAMRVLKSPVEIASTAAERLGERFGLSRVFYAEYLGTVMKVERDYTNGVASIVGEHDLEAFGPELLRAYHESPVVKVDDVRTDVLLNEEARSGLQMRQIGAFLDVVLFEEEQWVSLLAMQSATPRTWTASEEGLFREVAERVRSAIERARAEDQLRQLNETLEGQVAERTAALRRYHDIVDATVAPICAFDTDYRLIAFNRAHNDEFRRVNGFDTKVGDIFPDLFIPEQGAKMRALMSRALTGERFTVVAEFGRPELGNPCWEITYTPLLDEGGQVVGAFHHAVDISERLVAQAELEAAQEALRQSQKMEAMGQLTGGVAHDFNNLLTPIVGSLDMLQRKGIGDEREQRLIAGAAQSADRAKTLVQRLLAFARRQPLQPVPVDIAKLVHGMGDLVSSTTGPQIRVLVDAPDDLPPAKADPNQLEMALLNLSVNARDAMPNNGTLRISACAETVGAGHRSKLRPGTYVRLSVADTGTGMDEATIARAVEPFFSTKGVGKGTGLGLSMVHGLASQLGGALTIQSRPGLGTNVELWLPLSEAAPDASEVAIDMPPVPAVRGTALLVDDEELVRMSTADMLADLGYAVVEAACAEEAIRLAEEGQRFDLLVTDHLMPGMNGTELARAISTMKPEVPILLVSGYAETEGVDPGLPRLTKPFRKADLASSLALISASEGQT